MILPGTKVQVIASGSTGKGPNVGSVGYVAFAGSGVPSLHPVLYKKLCDRVEVVPRTKYNMLKCGKMIAAPMSTTVVFTRYGYRGRPRISVKKIQCLVPALDISTERTAKMFLSAVSNLDAKVFKVITEIDDEEGEKISDLKMADIVAKLHSYVYYLRYYTPYSKYFDQLGMPKAVNRHSNTPLAATLLPTRPITKQCCLLFKQIVLNERNHEVYKKALIADELVPTIIDLKRVVQHLFRYQLDTYFSHLQRRVYLPLKNIFMLQYLQKDLLVQTLYKHFGPSTPLNVLTDVLKNIVKVKGIYKSLSTDKRR